MELADRRLDLLMAKLVRMKREAAFGSEREADVHPDEVAAYLRGGYTVINAAQEAKVTSKAEADALPDGFPGLLMLGRAGIKTLDDIEGKTFDDLKAIPGIGAATAKAIITAANDLIGEE